MNCVQGLRRTCIVLACAGLLLPGAPLQAAQGNAAAAAAIEASASRTLVGDVALDARSSLHGTVVTAGGAPVAHARVVVWRADREIAGTSTDARGCFSVRGLRGGTYLIAVGDCVRVYRAWPAQTAPPKAGRLATVVLGDDLVRGQMPLEQFFASDAFIITALVGAMIAVPIAVYSSNDHEPSSP